MNQGTSAAAVDEFIRSQRLMLLRRYGHSIDQSQRALDRWDARWVNTHLEGVPTLSDSDIDRLVGVARAESSVLGKAILGPRLRAAVARILAPMQERVKSTHRWFTRAVSEDAGQHALDLLGLNDTWDWEPRSAADKLVSAKGSKAIEGLYGKHVDRLTKIVQDATQRRSPLSSSELRRVIREEWENLTRDQAELIARTESAHMWEATSYLAWLGNGVTEFDWIVAVGPSVAEGSVCSRCLAIAARNPWTADRVPLPPRHPLCRCALVPSLAAGFVLPGVVWTGGPRPA